MNFFIQFVTFFSIKNSEMNQVRNEYRIGYANGPDIEFGKASKYCIIMLPIKIRSRARNVYQ